MNTTSLPGVVALVTGSTRGIGRATALALAKAGADVIVNGRHAGPRADITRAAIEAQGVQALYIPADVSRAEDVVRLMETAWAWQDRVDVWVNNAGADVLSGPSWRQPWEERLEALLATDIWGTVRCSQLAGERMVAQGSGHIINIGWDQAERGGVSTMSGQLFSLVKGGIMSYTRALALALAPDVRVNCVAPGWIETNWGEAVSEGLYRQIEAQIPLQRWGTPEDVANAIVWLASAEASYLTGQTIYVNGGLP